jgi:hypothetical protein
MKHQPAIVNAQGLPGSSVFCYDWMANSSEGSPREFLAALEKGAVTAGPRAPASGQVD